MAAEAGTGQADSKPEVEHEDDEHVRTEDSSCGGKGDTRPLYTQATYPGLRAGAFRGEARRKAHELKVEICSNLSSAVWETVAEFLAPSFP